MQSKLKYEKKHNSFFFYLVLLSVFAVAIVSLVSMQLAISQKHTEYENLSDSLDKLLSKNEQLSHYAQDDFKNEYIEQIARDQLDYSYPDETVFYFIPE